MKIDLDAYRAQAVRIQGRGAQINDSIGKLDLTIRDPIAATLSRSLVVLAMPTVVVLILLIGVFVGLHFW